MNVTDLLQRYFSSIINVDFTAKMEDDLDKVANEKLEWHDLIRSFYDKFLPQLKSANLDNSSQSMKSQPVVSDVKCEKCGAYMVYKDGRYGKFLACPNYPKCKNIKSLAEPAKAVAKCPKCGKQVFMRKSKKGKIFYACEDSENCKFMSWDLPLEEKCPKCDCYLVQKETKNKIIKRCSNPDCDYMQMTDKPKVEQPDTASGENGENNE